MDVWIDGSSSLEVKPLKVMPVLVSTHIFASC